MPKKEGTQHKMDPGRVRAPRVQITYDVNVDGANEVKELPFVVGVMADLAGKQEQPPAALKTPKRKFVPIDGDNFDEVMKGIGPRLAYKVDNTLMNDETKIGVELRFNNMEDFGPEAVANQVEPLRKLVEVRKQLCALLAKTDGNDKLADRLQEIINNTDLQQKIGKEAGLEKGGSNA